MVVSCVGNVSDVNDVVVLNASCGITVNVAGIATVANC